MAQYDAFISYSHAKDKPIASALQSVIQRLGKPWYRRRALRVFRDDTSLSATPSLWPSIESALGNSRYLVLLASPEAAASPWVNKEVAYWLDHKSADTLLIALTEGVLVWDNTLGDFAWREGMPLPPVLTGRFATEPKWVDLNGLRDSADARNAKFIEAGADFAAAIHGVPKEDLLSQEVRQQRRALTLAWSAAGTLAVLIALAGWQWWEAEGAKRTAQRQRDRAVVAEQTATEQKDIAQQQRDRAETNFGIAKNAADHVVFRIAGDLRDVQGMRVESLRRILDAARSMMDELAKAAPDDLELQSSRSAMLREFSITYLRAGDLIRAKPAAEESLAIARKLVAADPGNTDWQRRVSQGLDMVGDVRLATGDRVGALAAYEESLAIRRKLVAIDPGNTGWQRDLSVSLNKVGDVRRATGDRAGALTAHEESLAIARKLAAADPGNVVWQRDVSVSLNKVGDVRRAAGDRPGALSAYEEGLAIMRKLAAADPGNTVWQRDVSVSLNRVGDVRRAAGDRPGALSAYEESLAIRRKLAATDPSNAEWQRDVGVNLARVGDVRLEAGDREGALSAYEEALAIIRKLAATDPGNTDWQSDVGQSLFEVGNARGAMGDRVGALSAYEESLAIRRKLAAADPGNAEWQADLVISLYIVGTVSDPPRARAALREALDIAEALARDKRLTAAQQNWPKLLRDALAKLPPEAAEAK